jgi:hypothetical protein
MGIRDGGVAEARRTECRQKRGRDQRYPKRVVAELTSAPAMGNPMHCAGLADKGALQMGQV